MHALRCTGKHKIFFQNCTLSLFISFRLRYAPIHADGPHHESRRGERRVSALNDRCLLGCFLFPLSLSLSLSLLLFRCLYSDSL